MTVLFPQASLGSLGSFADTTYSISSSMIGFRYGRENETVCGVDVEEFSSAAEEAIDGAHDVICASMLLTYCHVRTQRSSIDGEEKWSYLAIVSSLRKFYFFVFNGNTLHASS